MFSSRLKFESAQNPIIALLEKMQSAGDEVIDLVNANPTQADFEYDEERILRAIASQESLKYEPTPQGLLSTRSAISDYYQAYGENTNPDSIFLTPGTSESYGFLFKLLANPGDEVLIPKPGYPLFELLASLESVELIQYPLNYRPAKGWQIDIKRLENSISNKTVAIIVVNPNNPTGSFLKPEELAGINRICREFNLALIVDEVFRDYQLSGKFMPVSTVGNDAALTFTLNGFSKSLGLPQMKLGWTVISGPQELRLAAAQRLEYICDSYLSVGTPVQLATSELLKTRKKIQKQIQMRLKQNLIFLRESLQSISEISLLEPEGGWYAILQYEHDVSDEEFVYRLLETEKVFVHPGYFYDFDSEGYLVVSLLVPPENFHAGLHRLLRFLRTLQLNGK
jgi:alanine-synthesizing transaminase